MIIYFGYFVRLCELLSVLVAASVWHTMHCCVTCFRENKAKASAAEERESGDANGDGGAGVE